MACISALEPGFDHEPIAHDPDRGMTRIEGRCGSTKLPSHVHRSSRASVSGTSPGSYLPPCHAVRPDRRTFPRWLDISQSTPPARTARA